MLGYFLDLFRVLNYFFLSYFFYLFFIEVCNFILVYMLYLVEMCVVLVIKSKYLWMMIMSWKWK